MYEDFLKTKSAQKWKQLGLKRRAGVVVPLASIYSNNSIGIGDLSDAKLLIDWVRKSGQSILQFLPMNEVGPVHCPYDSTSAFAIEPMYLDITQLAGIGAKLNKTKINKLRKQFPIKGMYVNYEIKARKLSLLWEIFEEFVKTPPPKMQEFVERNQYWIRDVCLFNLLKFLQQGHAWFAWEEPYRHRDPQALTNLETEHRRAFLFQQWLQWQLYTQFRQVKDYAKQQGVFLKGDLPILVSRDSADVWAHPEYFKLEFDAGAPPDMYCAKGQRWGTPTYNWQRIFQDGGVYVKQKLLYAQNFYDILRIDHVVGLLRIWSIPVTEPPENKGLNGFFDPADEKEWEGHGRRIFELLNNSTSMLLCAEDLGAIPPACPKLLYEFGIPGNDVQRWTKDWQKRHDFLLPEEYRALSVSMLSTHDTTNWPAWWENEAGTVDEALFKQRCNEYHINYESVRDKLFDFSRSRFGRLRWKDDIDSVDKLSYVLGKPQGDLYHLIDMYMNSFHEKEKLWKYLRLDRHMPEACDKKILKEILSFTYKTNSIFCINFITDLLYLAEVFSGDAYQYRYNTPGTVSDKNWSLRMPLSLEELLQHPVTYEIKTLISAADRV